MNGRPEIMENGVPSVVGFSVGHVHGKLSNHDNLRKMFSAADELMYHAKIQSRKLNSGNTVQRTPYGLAPHLLALFPSFCTKLA